MKRSDIICLLFGHSRLTSQSDVVGVANRFKMIWVYAGCVSAMVMDFHTNRDGTIEIFIVGANRTDLLAVQSEAPVSMVILG